MEALAAIVKLGETVGDRKRIRFTTVESLNWKNRLDETLLTITVRILKPDNGASVAAAGTLLQPDVTDAKGSCTYTPTAGELDQVGVYQLIVKDTGDIAEQREIPFMVVPWDPYDATGLGLSRLDAAISTRSTQTSVDAIPTALSAALIDITAAAGHQHSVIDNLTYGSGNLVVLARERVFSSKAAADAAVAGHADNADGEVRRYTISCVDAGSGQFSSWKKTRTL